MCQSEGVDEGEFLSIGCGLNVRDNKCAAIYDRSFRGKLFEPNFKFLSMDNAIQSIPQIPDHLALATRRPLPAGLRQRKLFPLGQRLERAARIKRKGADDLNYRRGCDFDNYPMLRWILSTGKRPKLNSLISGAAK